MTNSDIPSILDLKREIQGSFSKNVYFLFGEDHQAIYDAIKLIEEKATPLLTSDFDKEIITAEKKQPLGPILDTASAYPFGSEKKLVVLKNFERVNDKNLLAEYLKSPADFTIFVLANFGKITSFRQEFFKSLKINNFLFEARKLRAKELVGWLINLAKEIGFKLSSENAQLIIDIVGDDTSMLSSQIQKYINFTDSKDEINTDTIEKLSTHSKEYNIFNLQDALSEANKSKSIEIAFNLLDYGYDIVQFITMLTKYFTTITLSLEYSRNKTNDREAASKLGVSHYYYIKCKKAKYFLSDMRLVHVMRCLLEADTNIKTTSVDQKTIVTTLISKIFLDPENFN